MPNLTPKQQAFALEYCLDFNGTAAARRAGYTGSPASLANIASQNLKKPHIRTAIDAHLQERAMSSAEVLHRLSEHARGSMQDFLSEDESGEVVIDLHKAYRRGALARVRYLKIDEHTRPDGTTHRRVEISLYDSLRALQLLARGLDLQEASISQPAGLEPDLETESEPEPESITDWLHEEMRQVQQAEELLLETFGDIETGLIETSKEVFGPDFQPSEKFLQIATSPYKDGTGHYRHETRPHPVTPKPPPIDDFP
jgi:phage terminase small subunit